MAMAAAALMLAACAGGRNDSSAFRVGYSDGCATASGGGSYRKGPVRDESLYAGNADYRAGWNRGLSICRQQNQEPGTIPSQTVPQPGPRS